MGLEAGAEETERHSTGAGHCRHTPRTFHAAHSNRTREDIERLADQLESDAEIIALRKRISQLAASRLENGVSTATEYLIERNAEEQAVLQQQQHRLEWIFSQVRLNQILGIS